MRAWILLSVPFAAFACGGDFKADSTRGTSTGDGGDTGGANSGGSSGTGSSAHTGGASSKGGSAGMGGAGGAVSAGGAVGMGGFAPPGGSAGQGGGIDCSNVGCGAPPLCDVGCTAPCGCCPCGDGQHQSVGGIDYVCAGGCYAPVAQPIDAGPAPACSYGGRAYHVGDSFRAGDGCNTCFCSSAGTVGCTALACVCDPANETHQRSYTATDPAACATIRYVCPANTTPFQNSCGCGCEQGLACPDWFDCMPGSGPSCDTNQIKIDCPYSGIAF